MEKNNYCIDNKCTVDLEDHPRNCKFYAYCYASGCHDPLCEACHYDVEGTCTSKEAIKECEQPNN